MTKHGGDVPDYIREHLPEELSDLPADLIYATHLYAHEFSLSAACRRSQETRQWLVRGVNCWGLDLAEWPGWAVDLARWDHEDWVRFRGMQEVAMRWVQEKRCPSKTAKKLAKKQAKKQAKMRTGSALASSQGQPKTK